METETGSQAVWPVTPFIPLPCVSSDPHALKRANGLPDVVDFLRTRFLIANSLPEQSRQFRGAGEGFTEGDFEGVEFFDGDFE